MDKCADECCKAVDRLDAPIMTALQASIAEAEEILREARDGDQDESRTKQSTEAAGRERTPPGQHRNGHALDNSKVCLRLKGREVPAAPADPVHMYVDGDQSRRVDMVDEEHQAINAVAQVKRCKVASDSGAVANVIHPDMLPDDVDFVPNTTGFHFVNAQGGVIQKFGSCKTMMKGKLGTVGCGWQAADVARALHSVSQTTGEPENPRQDVLYNASRCVVVPPGVVDYVLNVMGVVPVMEYEREGNLFTAEVELSSFPRQGVSP